MSNIESRSSSDEKEAAFALLNEHPLLKNDAYAKKVVEEGGLVDNGNIVDVGDFLAARVAVLESDEANAKVAAAKQRNPRAYNAAVIHSVAPHLERNLE
jgi:2-keto-4-pentenoate hydratase